MKNPLRKRLLRELRQEMGKYLVVFILMVATIGFVSGFLVADGSMLTAYDNSFEKYNIEDGNFATEKKVYKEEKLLERVFTPQMYLLPISTDEIKKNKGTLLQTETWR